jgi:tryptophan halogenase
MIKHIVIIGGGTAGLIVALILKTRLPIIKIEIIKSDKIGIIGVGEGSTNQFKEFMDVCNITEQEIIEEADATFKVGVLFEGWTPQDYCHSVNEAHQFRIGQYQAYYAYLIGHQIPIQNEQPILNKCIPFKYFFNQYHFNTFKLNDFLVKKSKAIGIKFTEDKIVSVETKKGIHALHGEKKKYTADFYIDATGFKKLLISKLGAQWKSFNLPMNEAIAFQTPDTDNYSPWTLAKAMTAGWMWRIPTYGRWGNGYIYDNHYINMDQAKREAEKYIGHPITIGKHVTFDAGGLETPWIENCVAMGLSATFAEPLEASSIGITIQQAFLLCHYLINTNQQDKDTYNKSCRAIFKNARDFIAIHYLVKRKEKFWKELKIDFSPDFTAQLKQWKNRLPLHEEFSKNYLLFYNRNFIVVLAGLGYFNNNKIKKELQCYGSKIKEYMKIKFNENKVLDHEPTITHKEYLRRIRNQDD